MYEKIFNITNLQRNTTQNDNGYYLIPIKIAVIKKSRQVVLEDVEKLKLFHNIGRKQNGADAMEQSIKVSQKIKNRTTI